MEGECLALLFHIQQISCSILIQESGYFDLSCLWFLSVPSSKSWDSTLNQATSASFLSNSLLINYHIILYYTVSASDSLIK
jgi:hypothetical protein